MPTFVFIAGTPVLVAVAWWLWPHCLRPALVSRGAGPVTYGLILGMNVAMMVGLVLTAVLELAHVDWAKIIGISTYVPWMIVVCLPYLLDEYRTLVRLTRGR